MGRRREHVAAIDVGTNAARLKVARLRGGKLEVTHTERAAVRPGEGVFRSGVMPAAVVDRLVETLSRFADVIRFHRAEVGAVATSALRAAANREAVVQRIARESGVELRVISGEEEARLTCLGVLAGSASEERALCIDVGGGSTEVILGRGDAPAFLHSIELGGVRLQEGVGSDDVAALRAAARACLRRLPPSLARTWVGSDATAVGCSGSVRALIAFATAGARRYVTRRELSSAIEELGRMSPPTRARFFEPRRAAVVLPAAIILEQTMERLDLWAVRSTRRGLRDGILLELLRARGQRLTAAS